MAKQWPHLALRYVIRRAAYAFFLLASVSIISFGLLQMAPGDYFENLRVDPRVSAATISLVRSQSGEGQSLPIRYARWLASVARGDWGYSLAYQMPAAKILWPRARNTLLLTGLGTLLAWLLALLFGIPVAAWRRTPAAWFFHLTISSAIAVPDILVALLFLLVAVRSGSLPSGGMSEYRSSASGSLAGDNLGSHLLLPLLCLVATSLPVLLAHVRSAVGETMELPFIRAARSYGLSPLRLFLRHVLRAAANPLISLMGLSVGGLLSSSLIVEIVFSWPGLGHLLLESVLQRDIYLVIDIAILSSGFLLVGNFAADLALYFLDARIKVT